METSVVERKVTQEKKQIRKSVTWRKRSEGERQGRGLGETEEGEQGKQPSPSPSPFRSHFPLPLHLLLIISPSRFTLLSPFRRSSLHPFPHLPRISFSFSLPHLFTMPSIPFSLLSFSFPYRSYSSSPMPASPHLRHLTFSRRSPFPFPLALKIEGRLKKIDRVG